MTRPQRVHTSKPGGTSNGPAGDRPRSRARAWIGAVVALTSVAALLPLLASACSPNAPPNDFGTESTGAETTMSGSGGSGQGGGDFFDAGLLTPITISPQNPILKLELPLAAQTIQFTCTDTGTGMPVDAKFTISSPDLGTLTEKGLFTPTGERTGEVTVKCEHAGAQMDTKVRVLIHALDNVGGLSPQQIDVLRGPPGQSDPTWQFMYPYDKTVFPRGILAPEIHLAQGSFPGEGFFVEISATDYHYEGFFNTSGFNTQLQMSQDAWRALTNSAGGQPVEVRVSKIYNNQKYGPIFRTWILAAGKLHGTVYYNTYDSPLAGNGAMMRVKGNSPTPEVLVGSCTVCHSVSSDGSTAAAANHNGQGGIFDLTGGNVNPPVVWQDPEKAAFAGIYPKNGEVFVVNGAPGFSYPPNTPGTNSMWKSELRTKNGAVIPNSGIEGFYAQTPVFSHDGKYLAFTDRQGTAPYPSVLAIMKYDAMTQKFSDYEVLTAPKAGQHLSWPAFTPDSKYVIYQDGKGEDLATWSGNTGRLFAVDIVTKQVIFLGNANGDGYMPAGARDENKNYEPTVSPLGSGGYFWLMFTSRRTYGNKLTGSDYETKRLWVSGISINPAPGTDASHPAFYVAGQELTSGNSRGFWAQDPCKVNGLGCDDGSECCEGQCNPIADSNPPKFVCAPPDGSCSDQFEGCKVSADCCDPEHQCLNGHCTFVPG
jgi:hypothetical protein